MPALGTPGFNGSRLREAREARGLSSVSLAELVGISRQVISQYELGHTAPTPDTLYLLAAKLNMPLEFFLLPTRAQVDRSVFYRSNSSATKTARIKAERRLDWLGDIIAYLAGHVEFASVTVPQVDSAMALPTPTHVIEQAATEIRVAWGLGDAPIANMLGLLESHGVIVTRGVLETMAIDAFSVRIGVEERPCMFLGADKDSAARSRFDAAHEMGHFVLHSSATPRLLMNATERKVIEDEAHYFASVFLLPASGFIRDLRAPTLEAMIAAKSKWVVSVGAMIQRCTDLEILKPSEAQRLWMTRAKRGWVRNEPLDEELPIEAPTTLRMAFDLVSDQGGVPRAQIASDFALAQADLEALAGLPVGYFSDDPAPVRLLNRVPSIERRAQPGKVVVFPGT